MTRSLSASLVSWLLVVAVGHSLARSAYADWHVEYDHGGRKDEEDDDSDELVLWGLAGIAAGFVATSPWWGPPALINDEHVPGYFQKYPYDKGGGYMELEGDPALRYRPFTFRVQSEFGSDFDEVTRYGANFHFETTQRWGFDAEFHDFEQSAPGIADSLQVGDVNLIARFAQSHHAQWWTGVGMNWLNNRQETDTGFNFTYGADIFIGSPWVLSGALDYGKQGGDDFFRGRATFGAHWKRLEVFVGYDILNTGRTEVDTVMLGGRLWF